MNTASADGAWDYQYPVLLWRKGYSYVASEALELSVHPRSSFDETLQLAKACEFRLADSSGRVFTVVDFERTAAFGGLKRFAYMVLRSVFARPVIGGVEHPDLPTLKATLAKALRGRFGKVFVEELESASDAGQVMAMVAKRDRLSG